MKITSLKDEDKIPIKHIITIVNEKMDDLLRVVDALNLGRTEVKSDGVYRTFNDGRSVLVEAGNFKKRRVPVKRFKLF